MALDKHSLTLGYGKGKVLECANQYRTASRRPSKGAFRLTSNPADPYLKYALFCHDAETGDDDELTFKGIIDLVELPPPAETPGPETPILAQVDVNLAFCIAGATPGAHHLMVAIKAPGIPLDTPPPQAIEWEEGILLPAVDQDLSHSGAAGRHPCRRHPAGRHPPGRGQFHGPLQRPGLEPGLLGVPS